MLDIKEIHNLSLVPELPNNLDIKDCLKNYLLFSLIEDNIVALTSINNFAKANNLFSKLDNDYELLFLDDNSFDNLYTKFLENSKREDISDVNKNIEFTNTDKNLVDFLKTDSDILTSEESAPIIKFVNALFYQAIQKKASDIHIETHELFGEIRYRINGILFRSAKIDINIIGLVISRIKVISRLDISEKRIPQDGRTQFNLAGNSLDVRVSILPSFYGEKVVLRILMQGSDIPKIEDLGFNTDLINQFRPMLKKQHGLILVTGPTGSGKTTSLHSFLKEKSSTEINIITVEDPVEYKTEGITQIQVNEKVGLTFNNALKSILRQDPDVIMVGEIRDEDTAKIAVRAALTGHLVFATLHTNSASATIARLADMNIEPFLISSSLLSILSQRLVRVLCKNCKEEDGLTDTDTIYKSKGCPDCNNTGFSERIAMGELLVMNKELKIVLKETTDEYTIQKLLDKQGLETISSQLLQLVKNGKTSLTEAIRIGLEHA